MMFLYTSVIMLYSLILFCILVIFSHYFPPTMSNAVLICLFRLSPLIWHALLSNFSVARFHWCNDFEEFYHTIISAAWSCNYLVFFFFFCLILTGLSWLFFFPIFDMHPHLTMNDMNFPCFLLCPLICFDKFCKILVFWAFGHSTFLIWIECFYF